MDNMFMQKVSSIDIPIIVLAGGLGTRLRTVVKDSPKIMAPIADKLFIDILLVWLESQGATSVVFSLGVMAEQVIEHIDKINLNNDSSMHTDYVVEPKPLGTLGAVAHCLREKNIDECLVMNGDTWLDVDLISFVKKQQYNHAKQALVCKKVDDVSRYGHIDFLDEHFIRSFNEKQAHLQQPGWINAGIYFFSSCAIKILKEHKVGSIEVDFLANCKSLSYFKVDNGAFIDIGTPESFKIAPDVLKEYLI